MSHFWGLVPVVVRVYLLDPRQQSKSSDGTLETVGYMLLAETK
ncbi:hypothetical protein [Streptococcus sp. A12]